MHPALEGYSPDADVFDEDNLQIKHVIERALDKLGAAKVVKSREGLFITLLESEVRGWTYANAISPAVESPPPPSPPLAEWPSAQGDYEIEHDGALVRARFRRALPGAFGIDGRDHWCVPGGRFVAVPLPWRDTRR
jgi:hypothetical protein